MLSALRRVADGHGPNVTVANVALAWVMAQGGGDLVNPIVGLRSVAHIEDNKRALALKLTQNVSVTHTRTRTRRHAHTHTDSTDTRAQAHTHARSLQCSFSHACVRVWCAHARQDALPVCVGVRMCSCVQDMDVISEVLERAKGPTGDIYSFERG